MCTPAHCITPKRSMYKMQIKGRTNIAADQCGTTKSVMAVTDVILKRQSEKSVFWMGTLTDGSTYPRTVVRMISSTLTA